MTVRIRSLFVKIFLWFWATVIATGIAMVAIFIVLHPKDLLPASQTNLAETAWITGSTAADRFERLEPSAASAYLDSVARKTTMASCLFDSSGRAVAGSNCARFSDLPSRAAASARPVFQSGHGFLRVALKLTGERGQGYIFAMEAGERRGPPPDIGPWNIALRCVVALLVSGLICYLLTRYITAPLLRLRAASRQLAKGDLSTRAPVRLERRRDELGSLALDFNSMAARIEALVGRQRQLIYDISHELRSPLARLNVALDLAREKKGTDPVFDQMEQDLECLNDMIGRLLTVARLDTASAPVPMAKVNLTELVSRIVRTAGFELQEHDAGFALSLQGEFFVYGNAELLHSAVENIVRNAIRYTQPGTAVAVSMNAAVAAVRILVRDSGPGVPESELTKIFQPFYRVEDDRNRQSGGAGLGLAIADRVARLHGGAIAARNAAPHGLEVEILLPCGAPMRQFTERVNEV